MADPDSRGHHDRHIPAGGFPAAGAGGSHGATASELVASTRRGPAQHPQERRRSLIAGLVAAIVATVLSMIFAVSFIGALHNPGPRSVPIGIVGPPVAAATLGSSLSRAVPGGFVVTRYPAEGAARGAIDDRTIDAALVPAAHGEHLLVAQAVGASLTNDMIKVFTIGAARSGIPLTVTDLRPLHASDPEGLAQTYFLIALLAPSFLFGNQLVTRIARRLSPLWQLVVIAVYAPIVAAVAVAIADAAIGALTGAPWGLFGIGTLLAFAVAVVSAAAARWAGGIGAGVVGLLFIPIGIASSGVTLGPNMITPWYADLGRALPPGNTLPAVQNTIYFHANAIITPLLVLSAWALAGILAMVMAAVLHPPVPGERAQPAPGGGAAAAAGREVTGNRAIV